MKNILFLLCAIAFFSANIMSVAHAHIENENSPQQIELNISQDDNQDAASADILCDVHCHNHMAAANFIQNDISIITDKLTSALTDGIAPTLLYGLKRPPRI